MNNNTSSLFIISGACLLCYAWLKWVSYLRDTPLIFSL